MSTKQFLANFLRDERGQSTTEYILILSVVVMIALKFKGKFQSQMDKAVDSLGANMDSALKE